VSEIETPPPSEGLPVASQTNPGKSGSTDRARNHDGGDTQPPILLLQEILDVERQRIASADKKTDINLRAIQAYDEADKREYELERHRIDTEASHRREVFRFLKIIVGGLLLLLVIALVLSFYFLFGDDPERRLIAENIIKYVFTAIGGYGVVQVLMRLINRTLNHH